MDDDVLMYFRFTISLPTVKLSICPPAKNPNINIQKWTVKWLHSKIIIEAPCNRAKAEITCLLFFNRVEIRSAIGAPTARPSHSIAVAIPDSIALSSELPSNLGAHKVLSAKNVPKVIAPTTEVIQISLNFSTVNIEHITVFIEPFIVRFSELLSGSVFGQKSWRVIMNTNTDQPKEINKKWLAIGAGTLLFAMMLPSILLLAKIAIGLIMVSVAAIAIKVALKTTSNVLEEKEAEVAQKTTQSKIINLAIGLTSILAGGLSLFIIAQTGLIAACAAITALALHEYVKNEEIGKDINNKFDKVADVVKFDMTYEKIKEIVTQNPDITAEEFDKELKKEKIDKEIIDQNGWTLLYYAVRSEGPSIIGDRSIFLKIVELFTNLNIGIDFKDTASRTVLGIAAINKQADVVRILLNSGKFEEEEKISALNSAIIQGNVQEFEPFLDYIDHAKILEALNTASCNENTDIMKVLLDNKRFTGEEKVQVLIGAAIDDDLPKVRLLLKHMTGIPEDGIRNLLKIIEERKLSLGEELKIDSEFKLDFNNPNHHTYLSNCVIIALLRSAINKKQNTLNVEENGAGLSGSNITTLNDGDIRNLCLDIERITKWDNTVTSLEDLQKRLKRNKTNFQGKREQNAVLEYAIKDQNLNVIKFLLQNGMTIINAIGQEGRHYISKIEEDKSILCSVVHYTDNSNAEILGTLLRNINAEQSKLNPEDELYILYQQSKDDAFCTAVAESNSVAATVLIQNDQETRASAVNKDETPVVTGTGQVITTPSVEENRTEPNKNVSNKPTATVPPILTKKTNPTTVPNSGNGRSVSNKPVSPVVSTNAGTPAMSSGNDKSSNLTNAQFSVPNEKEAKYKESKENFYTSLTKDVVGVVITGLFIAAAVMVPSVTGAVICGIVAALALVATVLHVKDSTLPSYREMEENKIKHIVILNYAVMSNNNIICMNGMSIFKAWNSMCSPANIADLRTFISTFGAISIINCAFASSTLLTSPIIPPEVMTVSPRFI
uniref:Uncharacterized protein n=1 Tax=Glossina austeni TaxID=7395 RepID=A0A1A9VJP3_GLOAU